MKYFYDTEDKVIYIDVIHDEIPDLCIEISKEQYEDIISARSMGMEIIYGEQGFIFNPVIQLPDMPTLSEVEGALREVRNKRLYATDWTQLPDSPLSGDKGILEYRAALRAIPQTEGFPMVDLPIAPDTVTV